MLGLKFAGVIGNSTCLFKNLYNMIPLLQVLLCCNVDQERFFKRLVTLTKPYSLQTKRAIRCCTASSLFLYIYHNRGSYNRCIATPILAGYILCSICFGI